MKRYLIFILLILASTVHAQDIKLEVIYTQPRVGQTFSFSLNLDFLEKYLKETLPSEMELSGTSAFTTYSNDIQVNDTGKFILGPFMFNFNGQTLKTDSVIIQVIKPLEEKEGIWIRFVENNSGQFLIIEQCVNNKWKKDIRGGEKMSMSLNTDYVEFAEFIERPSEDIVFSERESNTSNLALVGPQPLAYKRQIYKVNNNSGKDIIITNKSFSYLPKGFKTEPFTIKTTK